MTALDEWSARSTEFYVTTHNTHKRVISMRPTGFKPTIAESDRPQTYALQLTSIWCVKYYSKGLRCSYANAAMRVRFNTSLTETTQNVAGIYLVVLLNNTFFMRDLTNFTNLYWLIRSRNLPPESFGRCCCFVVVVVVVVLLSSLYHRHEPSQIKLPLALL